MFLHFLQFWRPCLKNLTFVIFTFLGLLFYIKTNVTKKLVVWTALGALINHLYCFIINFVKSNF